MPQKQQAGKRTGTAAPIAGKRPAGRPSTGGKQVAGKRVGGTPKAKRRTSGVQRQSPFIFLVRSLPSCGELVSLACLGMRALLFRQDVPLTQNGARAQKQSLAPAKPAATSPARSP